MILYVESSAILAWLLGEPSATVAVRELRAADSIVTSSLTALEGRSNRSLFERSTHFTWRRH